MYTNHEVILIGEDEEKDEFFCPVCTFPLATVLDFRHYRSYHCCHECYLTFCESRRKEWKEGWRPDKTVIEEYIYNRKCMFGIEEKT